MAFVPTFIRNTGVDGSHGIAFEWKMTLLTYLNDDKLPVYFDEINKYTKECIRYKSPQTTPIHVAASESNMSLLKASLHRDTSLISHRNEKGQTALLCACKEGNTDVVHFLLSLKNIECLQNTFDNEEGPTYHLCAFEDQGVELIYTIGEQRLCCRPEIIKEDELFTATSTKVTLLCDVAGMGKSTTMIHSGLYNILPDTLHVLAPPVSNISLQYGATLLHHTAKCRNVGATKQLLQYPGCAVDISDENSEYPIHSAARSGCTEIMKMLLQHDSLDTFLEYVDINRELFEYEYSSAKVGDQFDSEESSDEVVDDQFDSDDRLLLDHNKQLINVKNDMGMTPLHVACGRLDSNITSGYNQYFSESDTRNPNFCERKPNELTHDNIARLDTILQRDPSQLNMQTHRGDTALHLACLRGNIDVVKFLLSKHCSTRKRDKFGNTAFHHAAAKKRKEIMELLWQHHPSVKRNANRQGCSREQTVVFNLLLANQLCSVTKQDNFGYTALHYAAFYNQIKTMELLLLRDNSVLHVKSWKGKTALHVAHIAGSTDAAIFLANIDLSLNFRDNICNPGLPQGCQLLLPQPNSVHKLSRLDLQRCLHVDKVLKVGGGLSVERLVEQSRHRGAATVDAGLELRGLCQLLCHLPDRLSSSEVTLPTSSTWCASLAASVGLSAPHSRSCSAAPSVSFSSVSSRSTNCSSRSTASLRPSRVTSSSCQNTQ
ncbi:hypothetical protein B566_EDAN014942 [Ephemera danica]|nr:hypothetical protein B566_EDAN014942 [Ephemera danica]